MSLKEDAIKKERTIKTPLNSIMATRMKLSIFDIFSFFFFYTQSPK